MTAIASSEVYGLFAKEYDEWFEKHSSAYQSELLALKQAIPLNKTGIEIGIGTGRFAQPFNIGSGVEPSEAMAKIAEQRGIKIINAVAEYLPIENESYDFATMITTVCFLTDIPGAFSEVHRILKPKGEFIIGLIDRNSELGKKYEREKAANKFYQRAHFHSVEEIIQLLTNSGFTNFNCWQTLCNPAEDKIEQPMEGYGKGSFVVIKAEKCSPEK